MAKRTSILFLCTGNSARSQMAEGFARYYGGDQVRVESAGTRPVGINSYAAWAMNETGIDIAAQTSDTLDGKDLGSFQYLITLCSDARDHCPTLPPGIESRHWDVPDPVAIRARPADLIKAFRAVRNDIERRVKGLLTEILGGSPNHHKD